MGINMAINSELKYITPYDMTLQALNYSDNFNFRNIEKTLTDGGINLNDYAKEYHEYEIFVDGEITYFDITGGHK